MNWDVFITCAITGSGDTVGKSPHVPVTPEQIATSAIDAAKAGAAVVHIHVRDPQTGIGSRDVGLYAEVADRVRSSGVDVVLNLTAGMGGDLVLGGDEVPLPHNPQGTDMAGATERLAHVREIMPEICTLDCGTMNFASGGDYIMVNTPAVLKTMAAQVQALGPNRAFVVGRTSALDPAVSTRLHTLGVPTVTRIGRSDDPFLVAADAARVIGAGSRAVVVPYGAGSAEAGVGASLAAALGRPVLFLDRERGMPGATVRALLDLGVTQVDLVAADRSLPAVVGHQLQVRGITAVRSTGAGSGAAGLAVARRYGPSLAPSGLAMVSSSSRRVRDSVLAAAAGRLVLLTPAEVPAGTRDLLAGWHPASVWVASTADVLPPAVLRAVRDAAAG